MKQFKLVHYLGFCFLLVSCDSSREFRNDFYSRIENCFNNFHKSGNSQEISFIEIANFDWDSMAVGQGDESIGLPGNIISDSLGFECNSLGTKESRIYFIKNRKPVKIVDLETLYYKPAICFVPCKNESSDIVMIYSRDDTKFKVSFNTDIYEKGTVFLTPSYNDISKY